jgi:hypothetical protein
MEIILFIRLIFVMIKIFIYKYFKQDKCPFIYEIYNILYQTYFISDDAKNNMIYNDDDVLWL